MKTLVNRRQIPDLPGAPKDLVREIPQEIYEGLVVDVIVDQFHPDYAKTDGYNVGTIKIRLFDVTETLDDSLLPHAFPLDFTVQELPLIGEVVVLYKLRGKFFYTRKVPFAHRVQENGWITLNSILNNRMNNTLSNTLKSKKELKREGHKFGEYFKPDSRIRPLKHFEGDTIFQGRMGSSIRFGSSQMDISSKGKLAPNIIIRTGQGKNIERTSASTESVFGLILEDINKDASSIWMVSDQAIKFTPATKEAGSFYRSISKPVQIFQGAQVIINSDRVVLNSKKQQLMLFSANELYLNSIGQASIDSDESVLITANKDIQFKASRNIESLADEDISLRAGSDVSIIAADKLSLLGKKLHIGSVQGLAEPMVGGMSLSIFLARLIQALMGIGITAPQVPPYHLGAPNPIVAIPPAAIPGPPSIAHVITPAGPGQLSPLIISALTTLYTELAGVNPATQLKQPFSGAPFNSYGVFVSLSNEDSSLAVVKNEFKTGKPRKIENSTWKLSDSQYRVL